jgi:hypothetical protein
MADQQTRDHGFTFGSPFSDPKPDAPKDADEKTPQQKAADTRAKNKRAEERAERKAAKEAAEPEPTVWQRTYSCPLCGRGTTFADVPTEMPEIMRCEGCGCDSPGESWLPPGAGHGEPTLQTPRAVT